MTATILFALTATLYFVASALYLAFLGRGDDRVARAATAALVAALGSHVALAAIQFATGGATPFADIHQVLSILSLLVVVGWLVTMRGKSRLRVLGAFIAPVTLLLFLGAGFRRGVAVVGEGVRSMVLPFHVLANVLGVVAFALAFAVALAYLIQERQLRRKHLGGLYQRLPPLDVLDHLGLRLVLIGFPLFTLGVVTGTVWASSLEAGAVALAPQQTIGLLAWLTFAAVLFLRAAAGWRGRRAAIGTMIGFACACAVLVGYALRDGGT